MFKIFRKQAAPPLPRSFRALGVAVALSNSADGIRAVALPLVAAAITRDPALVAGLGVAQSLPHLVGGIPAGIMVDRYDRRSLLIASHLAQGLVFAVLVAVIGAESPSVPLLYGIAAALGSTETLRDVAGSTAVPALVPQEQLERANSRLVAAEFGMQQLIGPAAGSALFAAAALLPFVWCVALVVGAALLIRSLAPRSLNHGQHARPPTPAVPESLVDSSARRFAALRVEVLEGSRFLARNSLLRSTLVLGVALTLTDAAWFSILVLFIQEELGMGPASYGIFLAMGSVGGIAGALTAERVIRRCGAAPVLRGSVFVVGLMQGLIGVSVAPWTAAVGLAIGNAAFAVWHTAAGSLRQAITPGWVLGRVNGAWRTAFMGAAPLGFVLGGVLSSELGLRAPFLAGAPLVIVAAVLAGSISSKAVQAARASAASSKDLPES